MVAQRYAFKRKSCLLIQESATSLGKGSTLIPGYKESQGGIVIADMDARALQAVG